MNYEHIFKLSPDDMKFLQVLYGPDMVRMKESVLISVILMYKIEQLQEKIERLEKELESK